MGKRMRKILFLLASISLLCGCGNSKGNDKKPCDEDGVCHIGYKLNPNQKDSII